MTIGPVSSGSAAASIIAAHPPWQLPTIAGFALSGCSARTSRTNAFSASQTSTSVWPGSGSRKKITKYTGCPARSATPTCESSLKPPMPGTVARARVDDDVGAPLRIDRHAFGRDDAHERVVDRPRQLAPVDDGLVREVQDRRHPRARVLEEVVAALAQRVPEQDGPLRGVGRVLGPLRPRGQRGRGLRRDLRGELRAGRVHPFAIVLLREFDPLLQQLGDLAREFVAVGGEPGGVQGHASMVTA